MYVKRKRTIQFLTFLVHPIKHTQMIGVKHPIHCNVSVITKGTAQIFALQNEAPKDPQYS